MTLILHELFALLRNGALCRALGGGGKRTLLHDDEWVQATNIMCMLVLCMPVCKAAQMSARPPG